MSSFHQHSMVRDTVAAWLSSLMNTFSPTDLLPHPPHIGTSVSPPKPYILHTLPHFYYHSTHPTLHDLI